MKTDKSNIAISAIWYERFLECSRTYGTTEFINSVWRFYHSLLDIDNETKNIYTQVKNYLENNWRPKITKIAQTRIEPYADQSSIEHEIELIEREYIVEIFHFIIQTIQDSGIGWYNPEEAKLLIE